MFKILLALIVFCPSALGCSGCLTLPVPDNVAATEFVPIPAPESGPVEVDVMVVYTSKVLELFDDSLDGKDKIISDAISDTNSAFSRSESNVRIRLAYEGVVNYVAQDSMSKDLTNFRRTNDGFMDGVHELRDISGADICVLLTEGTSHCGVAYINRTMNPAFAFCVVSVHCIDRSFAHEVGHTFGADHDYENAREETEYGYGWSFHDPGGNFYGTIMSYRGVRIKHFSNPNVLYSETPTGTESANNARWIEERAPTIAQFRQPPSSDLPSISVDMLRIDFRRPEGSEVYLNGVEVEDNYFIAGRGIHVVKVVSGGASSEQTVTIE